MKGYYNKDCIKYVLKLCLSNSSIATVSYIPQIFITIECFIQGCDPIKATQRGKMQNQRSLINQQLCKQMRLRSGAENLFK